MARYLRLGASTVRRALRRLEEVGLIHKVTAFHGAGKTNCYVPFLRLSHFDRSDRNEDDSISTALTGMEHPGPSIPTALSAHSDRSDRQTEGTESESEIPSVNDVNFEEKTTVTSEIESQRQFISTTAGGMDTPAVDVPECEGGCGMPYTTPEKHLERLLRVNRYKLTLSDLICNDCWLETGPRWKGKGGRGGIVMIGTANAFKYYTSSAATLE